MSTFHNNSTMATCWKKRHQRLIYNNEFWEIEFLKEDLGHLFTIIFWRQAWLRCKQWRLKQWRLFWACFELGDKKYLCNFFPSHLNCKLNFLPFIIFYFQCPSEIKLLHSLQNHICINFLNFSSNDLLNILSYLNFIKS